MNLSELTDKLYAEGVEKGNAEAQEIIAKANVKETKKYPSLIIGPVFLANQV